MKRFNLLIIAVALFSIVLGGCDMILESVFPEVTIGTGDSDFSIAVTVEYEFNLVAQGFGPRSDINSIPIFAAFIPFYDNPDGSFQVDLDGIKYVDLWQDTFQNDGDGQDYRTTVEFNTWNNSTYKVLVWFDSNEDEDPNIDGVIEPGTLAIRNDNGNYWVDFRYMNPQNAGIQMAARVSATSAINVEQLTANPYGNFGSDGEAPYAWINSNGGNAATQNSEVRFDSYGSWDNDTNGWITAWNWVIEDIDGNPIAYGNGPEISHSFTDLGLYSITLKVQDNQGKWSLEEAFEIYVYPNAGMTEGIPIELSTNFISGSITEEVILDGGLYRIYWEDSYESSGDVTYTGDVVVSAYGALEPYYYFYDVDSGYYYPQTFYVSEPQIVYIDMYPYFATSPGTFKIWINRLIEPPVN
jgi:hypothetical protein